MNKTGLKFILMGLFLVGCGLTRGGIKANSNVPNQEIVDINVSRDSFASPEIVYARLPPELHSAEVLQLLRNMHADLIKNPEMQMVAGRLTVNIAKVFEIYDGVEVEAGVSRKIAENIKVHGRAKGADPSEKNEAAHDLAATQGAKAAESSRRADRFEIGKDHHDSYLAHDLSKEIPNFGGVNANAAAFQSKEVEAAITNNRNAVESARKVLEDIRDALEKQKAVLQAEKLRLATAQQDIRVREKKKLDRQELESRRGDTAMSHVFRSNDIEDEKPTREVAASISYRVQAMDAEVTNLVSGVKHLQGLVERRNKVREQIVSMDNRPIREELVEIATHSMREAREYYKGDHLEEGRIAATIAEISLDIATSATPGVSWGRDIFEAISGKNLINGEDLDIGSRSIALLGAASFGFGSKIAKALSVFGRLLKGAHAKATLSRCSKTLETGRRAADVRWGMWGDLKKVVKNEQEYAEIGNRLYTKHAIDRMTPSAFGTAVDGHAGRSIPTMVVEHILEEGQLVKKRVENGAVREVWKVGTVQVVTEQEKTIVVTVMRVQD